MRKNCIKRFLAATLSFGICILSIGEVLAVTDSRILTDKVSNIYNGTKEGTKMIQNLDFNDVSSDFWAKESIVRSGSLDFVKGYSKKYSPNNTVTNQEAIAFVLRAVGEEQASQDLAVTLKEEMPENSPLRTLWSIGYLNRAMQLGLITADQYDDALSPDQSQLDPKTSFLREKPSQREQVADWLVKAMERVNPQAFTPNQRQQSIYPFSDWSELSVEYVKSMEKALQAGIFKGDKNGKLKPKGTLTRAEMAQILRNTDSIFYNMNGITRKNGTVGAIKDSQTTETGNGVLQRDIYVRAKDGSVDILRYRLEKNSSPQAGTTDSVVLKGGKVGSITNLTEGDEIEYLVKNANTPTASQTNPNPVAPQGTGEKVVVYVNALNSLVHKSVKGFLKAVNFDKGSVTITDNSGKDYEYMLVDGVLGKDAKGENYLLISQKRLKNSEIPYGSIVDISTKNNVADQIVYIGEQKLVDESRGIVTENDPELGMLSYITNAGNIITKNYLENDLKVKKLKHFDRDDNIGYLSEMFPNFDYNPLETTIDQIEPGDIVFIRLDPNNQDNIVNISAATNYISKYGKIKEFTDNGDYHSLIVEYENKQVSQFDVADDVFVSTDGKPSKFADIKAGDYVRLLLNQAIIEPGVILESVKEMAIEGDEHYITTVVKGQLGGVNSAQKKLIVQNSQKLSKVGWGDFKDIEQFSLAGKDIEFYNNGKKVNLDYALKYLKRGSGNVYIALENNYSGEKIKKVSFRDSRDELLDPDTVLDVDATGAFKINSNNGHIETDAGTIVIKNGRLVGGNNIETDDFVTVSLNAENKAAIVSIGDTPQVSKVSIMRARVASVKDAKSFTVKSISILNENKWDFSPIEREFTIDNKTIFINGTGVTTINNFLEYGDTNVKDKVFLLVVSGDRAERVIEAPYSQFSARGTVYSAEGGVYKLKDARYYDRKTGKWETVSDRNNVMSVKTSENSLIVKDNKVVSASDIKKGDTIKIMTEVLPNPIASGMEINGYIISVEK